VSTKLAWYHDHFACPLPESQGHKEWQIAPYLHLALPAHKVAAMARFRTRNHFLGVEIGSWRGAAESAKLCSRCDLRVLDDEQHYFFVCPGFRDIRRCFPSLFDRPDLQSLASLTSYSRKKSDWALIMKEAIGFLLAAGCIYE
jgi:hypothetical protein